MPPPSSRNYAQCSGRLQNLRGGRRVWRSGMLSRWRATRCSRHVPQRDEVPRSSIGRGVAAITILGTWFGSAGPPRVSRTGCGRAFGGRAPSTLDERAASQLNHLRCLTSEDLRPRNARADPGSAGPRRLSPSAWSSRRGGSCWAPPGPPLAHSRASPRTLSVSTSVPFDDERALAVAVEARPRRGEGAPDSVVGACA